MLQIVNVINIYLQLIVIAINIILLYFHILSVFFNAGNVTSVQITNLQISFILCRKKIQ